MLISTPDLGSGDTAGVPPADPSLIAAQPCSFALQRGSYVYRVQLVLPRTTPEPHRRLLRMIQP
jgi:hypothetical protein